MRGEDQEVLRIPIVKLLAWGIIAATLVAITTLGVMYAGDYWCAASDPAAVAVPKRGHTFDEILHAIEAAALVVAAIQIVILYGLGRSEAGWRKLLTYHQFFSDCPEKEHRAAMMAMMDELKSGQIFKGDGAALGDALVTTIMDDEVKLQKVKLYLDGFEQLAAAIHCRVVDGDYAFCNEAGRVVRAFKVFRPIIIKLQQHSASVYIEFEELAETWEAKKRSQVEKDKKRARQTVRGPRAPD